MPREGRFFGHFPRKSAYPCSTLGKSWGAYLKKNSHFVPVNSPLAVRLAKLLTISCYRRPGMEPLIPSFALVADKPSAIVPVPVRSVYFD
jgi:hypothetical protein